MFTTRDLPEDMLFVPGEVVVKVPVVLCEHGPVCDACLKATLVERTRAEQLTMLSA